MKALRYFILMLLLFTVTSVKSQCLQANIVLLMDWSGSENGNERLLGRSALLFADKLPISEYQVQISIIAFSSSAIIISEMSGDRDLIKFNCLLLSTSRASGNTVILDAIQLSIKELILSDRDVRNIIVIISDGEIEDSVFAEKELRLAETKIPLNIFAVQIGGDENGGYTLIKLTGDKNNVVGATSTTIVEALMGLDMCN